MHPSPHVHLCVRVWWELSIFLADFSVVSLVTMVYTELSDLTHTWKSVLLFYRLCFPHPPNLETIFLRVWPFPFFLDFTYGTCSVWLIPLSIMPSRSVLQMAEFLLSSWLNNSPPYAYMCVITTALSIQGKWFLHRWTWRTAFQTLVMSCPQVDTCPSSHLGPLPFTWEPQ